MNIQEAAKGGILPRIVALLNVGANIETRNEGHYTPLMLAAKNSYMEVALLLVELSANIDNTAVDTNSLLIKASSMGNIKAVKILLKEKININQKDHNGCNALMHAAQNGHAEVVQMLLANHANINILPQHEYNSNIQRLISYSFFPRSLCIPTLDCNEIQRYCQIIQACLQFTREGVLKDISETITHNQPNEKSKRKINFKLSLFNLPIPEWFVYGDTVLFFATLRIQKAIVIQKITNIDTANNLFLTVMLLLKKIQNPKEPLALMLPFLLNDSETVSVGELTNRICKLKETIRSTSPHKKQCNRVI